MITPRQQLQLLLQNRDVTWLPRPTRDHRSVPHLIPQGTTFTISFKLEIPAPDVFENPALWDKIPILEPTTYQRAVYRDLMQWHLPEGFEDRIRAHFKVSDDIASRHDVPSYSKMLDTAIEHLTVPTQCFLFNRYLMEAAIDYCMENKVPNPNDPSVPITEDSVGELSDHQILDALTPEIMIELETKITMPEFSYKYEPRWDNIFADLPELAKLYPTTNCEYTLFVVATPTHVHMARGDGYGSGSREILGYYGYGYELLTPTPKHFIALLKSDASLVISIAPQAPYYPWHGCNYKNPLRP